LTPFSTTAWSSSANPVSNMTNDRSWRRWRIRRNSQRPTIIWRWPISERFNWLRRSCFSPIACDPEQKAQSRRYAVLSGNIVTGIGDWCSTRELVQLRQPH